MIYNFRGAMKGLCIITACMFIFGFNYAYAGGDAAVSVLNTTGSGTVTITVKNIDGSTSSDGIIRWTGSSAEIGAWRPADQYIEISHSGLSEEWGMQIYTDNKNSTPAFTGKGNPAGLVRVDKAMVTLPLAWRISERLLTPTELSNIHERFDAKGMSDYLWYFMKDKNTKDDDATPEDETFINGEDYITFWNQKGIASSEGQKVGNPGKAYLYLGARFITSPVGVEYKTTTLTIEAYHGISAFPFYLYKDGAPAVQLAYGFINSKMDKYFSQNEKRLIESYSDPYPPGTAGSLEGVAFTYDNALAISAYLARPTEDNLRRAKLLCQSFIWAQDNDLFADGRVRDAYDASSEFTGSVPLTSDPFFRTSSVGNIVWFINALAQYYKNSSDTDTVFLSTVLSAAERAGEFIHTNFYDARQPSQPGYLYGYFPNATTKDWSKSTEHNISAYIAFSHLYDITGDSRWLTRANNAKSFVDNIAWHSGDKRYICGLYADRSPNRDTLVADTTLLAVLAFGNLAQNNNAINYVVNHFSYYDPITHLQGIDFGYNVYNSASEPDGIWFEGTAQLAAAYKVAGAYGCTDDSAVYIDSIKRAQYDAQNADYKSIVAASKNNLTTGLGWGYYSSPHIGATAWFAACKMNYNLLWGTSLSATVPSPGDNISFSHDPSLLVDDDSYLENHYIPSGIMNYAPGVVAIDQRCIDNPHSGDTCFKIAWNGQDGAQWKWSAVVWQEPENEWSGGTGKGYDLRGADYLSFWARTDNFSYVPGKLLKIFPYFGYSNDSCGQRPPTEVWRELTTEWKQYMVPVSGNDMSHVSNGFTVMFNEKNTPRVNGCNIYIDDIEYKKY